jgi:non-ribosomal peptide synthetase component F
MKDKKKEVLFLRISVLFPFFSSLIVRNSSFIKKTNVRHYLKYSVRIDEHLVCRDMFLTSCLTEGPDSKGQNIDRSLETLESGARSITTLEPNVSGSFQDFLKRSVYGYPVACQLAWSIVLARHQAQDTIVFYFNIYDGERTSQTAGTQPSETFPVAVNLSDGVTVLEALQVLHTNFAQSKGNADIVSQAKYNQNTSLLSIQSLVQIVDHETNPYDWDTSSSNFNFPLILRLSILDGVHFTLNHGSTISKKTAKILGLHFHSALKGILASDTDKKVDEIDLLSDEETGFLYKHALSAHPPSTELLHILFEKQAVSTPDAIAIENEDGSSMTYRELNDTADRVSKALSCGPGCIVPVCIERSNMLIVALLAVLKSGAAYVIIDPEYPKERQKLIADDVKAPFILVSSGLRPRILYRMVVSTLTWIRPLYLEFCLTLSFQDVETVLSMPNEDWSAETRVGIDAKHAAYLIYTSGSTGKIFISVVSCFLLKKVARDTQGRYS